MKACEPSRVDDALSQPVSYRDALTYFQRRATPVAGVEMVSLRAAVGRVLAEDVDAPRPVPAFDNAAVDGFAFAWAPSLAAGGRLLLQEGRSAAGHGLGTPVQPGCAVQILTGAPMPAGTDTVAPVERCRLDGSHVQVPQTLTVGANRRRSGEDVELGMRLLRSGTRLDARHVAIAASLGRDRLRVNRLVRVMLFSTGDELLPAGDPWRQDSVYDANRPLLAALLADLPVDLVDRGIVRDDRAAVVAVLDDHRDADLVLSTGGASRGDEDHVASTLAERGWLDFWRVALRPGKPIALGAFQDTVFAALPGNPVAAALAFLRFVRPLVVARAGAGWHVPEGRPVRSGVAIERQPHRTELVRCRLMQRSTDEVTLTPVARDGSSLLTTLLEANGIAEIEAGSEPIEAGQTVPFLSWPALGLN